MKDRLLQEHIHISYMFRNIDEHLIAEEHGYVPNLDKYLECFRKALPEKFTSGKIFNIEDDAFESIPNVFFKNILIQVGVTFVADATGYPKGQYYPDKAYFSEKTKKLWNPVITILYVTGSGSTIVDQLTEAFAHELTHCYEDYQRGLKGKNSLDREYDIQHYRNASVVGPDAKFSEKFLKGILYFLNRQEQHAYVGELKAIFQQGTKDQLKNSKEVFKLLENSEFYVNYNAVKKRIERLRSGDFKPVTKDNMVTKFQEIYPKNKRVQNFHDLAKLLISRWDRWDKKFRVTVGKIAYDVYLDKLGENKTYNIQEVENLSKNHWTNIDEYSEY